MKKTLFAALIVGVILTSCTVTQPEERYYPQQSRVYAPTPYYGYDPYNNSNVYSDPYYRTNDRYSRRYDRRSYNRSYSSPYTQYPNTSNRRYSEQRQQQTTTPRYEEQKEKRLPDGTRVTPDGRMILPNGKVVDKRNQ